MLALCYSTSVFHDDIPFELIEKQACELMPDTCTVYEVRGSRDRIFTPCNVILTMLLSATKEDTCTLLCKSFLKALFSRGCVSDAERLCTKYAVKAYRKP